MYRIIAILIASIALLCIACGEGNAPGETEALQQVPRNRTMILGLPQMLDYDSFNPYLPGVTSDTGFNFLFEPLYFYNAYGEEDNLLPWIAEGHQYNEDFTEVTIKIRPGVEWSDGHPWTVHDLVFTINMLKENAPELSFSTDMNTWVAEAIALDSLTAKITLNAPNPRFVFSYFTHNFDNGVPIVPKHIWQDQADPGSFPNLDIARGWPVVSGPYRLALSAAEQRIWDVRDDWWAAKTGFQRTPRVERLIYLPFGDETKWVQMLMADQMDSSTDLRPSNIKSIIDENPNVTTWTGRQLPYGYRDWWPCALGFNNLEEPFSDPDVRWAINHAIDRRQLVEIGWQGAGEYSLLPFPGFPPLQRFFDSVSDLVEASGVGVHDPAKTAEIMQRKGWSKDGEGFWSKDGRRASFVIDVVQTLFGDITPVLVAQLRRAGFDASFRMTSDAYTRMSTGTAQAFIFGNGGSVRDPYFTLRLYHSRFVQPTGTATQYFWRWKNERFDGLVDQMGQTAVDNPALTGLFHQAMEIWLRELPAIPLVQWFHRIPHNQTYWTGWPTAEDPYINSAYWHRTWLRVLLRLEPTQS
jgi:peptide/nickel transport system substrate-binding protein